MHLFKALVVLAITTLVLLTSINAQHFNHNDNLDNDQEYTVYVDGTEFKLPNEPNTPPFYQYMDIPDTKTFNWSGDYRHVENDTKHQILWYTMNLTSLQWLTTFETNSSIWKHHVMIGYPYAAPIPSKAMLYITGCDRGEPLTSECYTRELELFAETASKSGLLLVVLFNAPNQPSVIHKHSPEAISEDHLAAYTWNHTMYYPDRPDWIIYFPMAKASLRVMDAIELWSEKMFSLQRLPGVITQWFIFGCSKRGAATWFLLSYLGARQPERILGAAPIVYDALNFRKLILEGMPSKLGGFSHVMSPYRDIIPLLVDPHRSYNLIKHIDFVEPWYLTGVNNVKKYIISAAMDEFFLLGNDRYWYDLIENKHRITVPSASHGFFTGRDWLTQAIAAYGKAIATNNGTLLPKIIDKIDHASGTITMCSNYKPTAAVYYRGKALKTTPQRLDFRMMKKLIDGCCDPPAINTGDRCYALTDFKVKEIDITPVTSSSLFSSESKSSSKFDFINLLNNENKNNDNDNDDDYYDKDTENTFIGQNIEIYKNEQQQQQGEQGEEQWCATYTEHSIPDDTYVASWITFSWDEKKSEIGAHAYNTPVMLLPDKLPFDSCLDNDGKNCPTDTFV